MHLKVSRTLSANFHSVSRPFHSSTVQFVLQQKPAPQYVPASPQFRVGNRNSRYNPPKELGREREDSEVEKQNDPATSLHYVKRNELGVQLLSRKLHAQIFRNVDFPAPPSPYIRIARDHLEAHGLDPTQGSILPDTGFTLPSLQGANIDEHFHRIGAAVAEPWLSLSKTFAATTLPPRPELWHIQSGWTKYYHHADGSGYSEHVEFPQHDGQPEEMLAFDVESMPAYHPYAVLACAATPNGWYSWISPWLLGESSDPRQLIPLGDPQVARVVVGHNVSYDRARVREEYSIAKTGSRFVDTMALHVAVAGISSHQRPAWMKHRKSLQEARDRKAETVEAVVELLRETENEQAEEVDSVRREELKRRRRDLEESLPLLQADDDAEATEAEMSSKRWENITSANSLADVAKLHCGIELEKETRNDFLTHTPAEIIENIQDYLNYCSTDVFVTHSVFSCVLPAFLSACPHPVSFAGILDMGSSFLTVNSEWEKYLENAERTYKDLDDKVKKRLLDLAEEAKKLMEGDKWKDDAWLSQLDWSPKVAGKSRGVFPPDISQQSDEAKTLPSPTSNTQTKPAWYKELLELGPLSTRSLNRTLPLLLNLSFDNIPLRYSTSEKWHYIQDGHVARLPSAKTSRVLSALGPKHGLPYLKSGRMSSSDTPLALLIASGERNVEVEARVLELAKRVCEQNQFDHDPWLNELDWTLVTYDVDSSPAKLKKRSSKPAVNEKPPPVLWPKWYWDLAKPKKDFPPGSLDVTVRNRIAPILLRLSWQGWPLFHSREHGWTFRVPRTAEFTTRLKMLDFYDPADDVLQESSLHGGFTFYKLPHKDGDEANVGSPLAKTFIKYAQDGTLTSPGDEAKGALDMNAQCSYWISARDRILKQMVVWQDANVGIDMGARSEDGKLGMILPQVITMGTVTRRAIEKTWLTASNAKANRVGSELKAMVRAPAGYALVGADVDSEELWISSAMGDAQFGLHGATAIGWMTLEGTKKAGTDLHSKTASILGISRDQAKVFNYSRIYGAGMRHAVLLLLQSNAGMLPETAQKLAEALYASTKGKNTHRTDVFGRKFWFGGTESFVFNKLEEIALSEKPQTPALGCGITYALSKEHLPAQFGADYMTSRINWVVQSSGVDYLHLLIVAMEHLTKKYDIDARYLISVHDELRYLVKEEDRYRAALALQVANLWTRSLFAYRLGMDDLPQGVAFFSAVDVDTVLRKEVDMPCVTPSQPVPIPPGESLDIGAVLEKTSGGSLWKDGRRMLEGNDEEGGVGLEANLLPGYTAPNCLVHRAPNAAWLRAQATSEFGEIKTLAKQVHGKKVVGGIGGGRAKARKTPEDGASGKFVGRRKLTSAGEGNEWGDSGAAEVELSRVIHMDGAAI